LKADLPPSIIVDGLSKWFAGIVIVNDG